VSREPQGPFAWTRLDRPVAMTRQGHSKQLITSYYLAFVTSLDSRRNNSYEYDSAIQCNSGQLWAEKLHQYPN
jgi:hypothetical protein